ncbi:hypothetical protein [Xenorhabdus griffiniae]|nr:hypothetical protein [Xenorhabdus griffiniae]
MSLRDLSFSFEIQRHDIDQLLSLSVLLMGVTTMLTITVLAITVDVNITK